MSIESIQESEHFRPLRPEGKKSIVRGWVEDLPPRLQGTLFTCVRGCDTVEREDPVKLLSRCLRAVIMHTASSKPGSFVMLIDYDDHDDRYEFQWTVDETLASHDHLPLHYVMHLLHGAEIVAYMHPNENARQSWLGVYAGLCHHFHLRPESKDDMLARLTADEKTFIANQ